MKCQRITHYWKYLHSLEGRRCWRWWNRWRIQRSMRVSTLWWWFPFSLGTLSSGCRSWCPASWDWQNRTRQTSQWPNCATKSFYSFSSHPNFHTRRIHWWLSSWRWFDRHFRNPHTECPECRPPGRTFSRKAIPSINSLGRSDSRTSQGHHSRTPQT